MGGHFCIPYNVGKPEVVWRYQVSGPSAIVTIHIGPQCCKDTGPGRKILDNLDIVSGAGYNRPIESLQRKSAEDFRIYTNGSAAANIESEGEWRTGTEVAYRHGKSLVLRLEIEKALAVIGPPTVLSVSWYSSGYVRASASSILINLFPHLQCLRSGYCGRTIIDPISSVFYLRLYFSATVYLAKERTIKRSKGHHRRFAHKLAVGVFGP